MGRLFWKFFFFIWLAQLTAILATGATFWLEHRAQGERLEEIDRSPVAGLLVESAATLKYGGASALRSVSTRSRKLPPCSSTGAPSASRRKRYSSSW